MRVLFVLAAILTASTVVECASMRIDGVLVHGKLEDVSRADIREAIAANGPVNRPFELQVISSNEMHAYFRTRDLGWTPIHRVPFVEPDGRKHLGWSLEGSDVDDTPEALRLIRTAHEIYVFPVTSPLEPHRDDKHLRLLGSQARREVVRLLGVQRNWCRNNYSIVLPESESTNVGLIFRSAGNELVLFFSSGGLAQGTFNGEHTGGFLVNKARELERWTRRYAQPELAAK